MRVLGAISARYRRDIGAISAPTSTRDNYLSPAFATNASWRGLMLDIGSDDATRDTPEGPASFTGGSKKRKEEEETDERRTASSTKDSSSTDRDQAVLHPQQVQSSTDVIGSTTTSYLSREGGGGERGRRATRGRLAIDRRRYSSIGKFVRQRRRVYAL